MTPASSPLARFLPKEALPGLLPMESMNVVLRFFCGSKKTRESDTSDPGPQI
jgi:hypothetical protein